MGGRGAATRKLPTPIFKFLLGFRELNFENSYAKQKSNILSAIFRQSCRGIDPSLSKLEGQLSPLPPSPYPCSYAYGQDFVQEGNLSRGPYSSFPLPQEEGKVPTFPLPKTEKKQFWTTILFSDPPFNIVGLFFFHPQRGISPRGPFH